MDTTPDATLLWYELGWQAAPAALVLRVGRGLWERFGVIPDAEAVASSYFKEFGFEIFSPSLAASFGFDDALVQRRSTDERFVEFVGELPPVIERDSTRVVWQDAYALAASLKLFFARVGLVQSITFSPHQLLDVQTVVEKRISNGAEFGGRYSALLVGWLAAMAPGTILPEVVEAMIAAHDMMFGAGNDTRSFQAIVSYQGGWLNISCPGNACGLHPHNRGIAPGAGYEFVSHNVDSPAQQLMLLSGLGALCDKFRRESSG